MVKYCLIWKNETIEEGIATYKEALYLLQEYTIAFNDNDIEIKKELKTYGRNKL